jgi:hypothetical protein
LILLFFSLPTLAQVGYSRFEVGPEFDFTHLTLPHFSGAFGDLPEHSESILGFGGQFSWNVYGMFAIGSEISWYPRRLTTSYLQDGGRVLEASAGPKLAFYKSNHFGLFGYARPGLFTFGQECIITSILPSTFACEYGRVTHFALGIGGSVEAYPLQRLIVEVGAGETLVQMYERNATLQLSSHFFESVNTPGGVRPALRASVGIRYRVGHLKVQSEKVPALRKWEIGPQVGFLSRGYSTDFSSSASAVIVGTGFGGRASYNFTQHVALDAAIAFFPSDTRELINFQDGGNSLEALFGLKAGLRRGKIGYFAKARPGFVRFSKSLTDFGGGSLGSQQFIPTTHPLLDLGYVMEIYTSTQTMVRFDAGDTLTFIQARTLTGVSQQLPTVTAPGDFRHAIELAAGFGFRF